MRTVPLRLQGYQLLHDGACVLAEIEANGIRIDLQRLERTKEEVIAKIRSLKEELRTDPVWKAWVQRFGSKANMSSHHQLAEILIKKLGYKVRDFTPTGAPKMSAEALSYIDLPFVQKLVMTMQYEKALGTFIKGIEREVFNGRLHPIFNLHTARTYRSSSDSPNFQNFPVRNKEIAKIIRSLFIPSTPQHALVENDFKGIEVNVSACYHKDRNFISYITTPGKDMHRDMAAQIYMLKPEEVSKDARYGAKNKFVFPQFYGDFYVACARNLWEWIDKGKLTGPKGIPLKEHLRSNGINRLGECDPEQDPKKGTFEHHLQEVESDFWNNRFGEYGQWRKDWYYAYLDKGYFDLYTGFRIEGTLGRNEVTNYPIQGSAFHCLLWVLIQVNRKLAKYRMKSKLVGQIHDSLIGDVPLSELRDYLEIVESTATVELREHWDWIIVPMEIEYEICPVGESWFEKKEMKFKQGLFKHPTLDKWTHNPEAFMAALKASPSK